MQTHSEWRAGPERGEGVLVDDSPWLACRCAVVRAGGKGSQAADSDAESDCGREAVECAAQRQAACEYVSETGTNGEQHASVEDAATADSYEAEHPDRVREEIARVEEDQQQSG